MKKWQYVLSSALLLGGIAISNVSLALTPGYYARMEYDKLTGQITVLEHKGTQYSNGKTQKATLKVLSITNHANPKGSYSLNATYYDLKKNIAVTDKALIYYGNDYTSFNGIKADNVARLYEEGELLPLKIEETSPGVLEVTSSEPGTEGYLGTYVKQETFFQASHPLTIFTLEQQTILPPGKHRTYVINTDNNLNYNIVVRESGEPIASFITRIDLSKIVDAQTYKPIFISDFARKYDAQQAKKAKG